MAHLLVTLAVDPRGVLVRWRLDDVAFRAGELLGQSPLSIAGAPALQIDGEIVAAVDELGPISLVTSLIEGEDGEQHCWSVERSTSGSVEVSYLAEPVAQEPRPATPPLELRREDGGLSGALKCFVVLPPGPEDLTLSCVGTHRRGATVPPTVGWLFPAWVRAKDAMANWWVWVWSSWATPMSCVATWRPVITAKASSRSGG